MPARTLLALCATLTPVAIAQTHAPERTSTLEITAGVLSQNDGTFNYQGVLTDNGEPANGMYAFFIEPYSAPDGFDIAHELLFFSDPVPVVDGLFSLDIQMGGTPSEARRFWREIGDEPIYLEIGVGLIKGGPYTTLGTRAKVGWGARAQYAGIAESLRFPYDDVYTNVDGDPVTMISLTNVFGGSIIRLTDGENTDAPILDIRGETRFGLEFGNQNGAIRIDAMSEQIGLVSAASQYSIVGVKLNGAPAGGAGVLGQINPGVTGARAVMALNNTGGTFAYLATDDYAGDFSGDVRVDGQITRGFGSSTQSPAGPIAYASISSSGTVYSGTSNLSVVWNAASQWYEITVSGENITFPTHVASVSVIDAAEPRIATVNATGGDLIVKIWDLNSGNIAVQDNFHVVIHNPDPGAALLNAPPLGSDEGSFERAGREPVVRRSVPVERARPRGIGG